MSMLAERKQKVKWTHNPRGKFWSDDNNKFGQKMLEKMGWTAGKGLGTNEDGITEHVKQTFKNDAKGVGYYDKDDEKWSQHQTDFSELLKNLGQNAETDTDVKRVDLESLEKKSQKSRVRLHYKKFTRGKDLTKCSERDLANVFGKKSLGDKELAQVPQTIKENNDEQKFGVTTVNGGSMADYFKVKMKKVPFVLEIQQDTNDVCKTKKKKCKIGYFDNSGFTEGDVESTCTTNDHGKSADTSTDFLFVNGCFDNPAFAEKDVDINEKVCRGKKKRIVAELCYDNPTFASNISGETQVEGSVCAEVINKKKRKKIKKPQIDEVVYGNTALTENVEGEEPIASLENDEVKYKIKKKRKLKLEDGINIKKPKRQKDCEGLDNQGCEAMSLEQTMEEAVSNMASELDKFQNNLENEMNTAFERNSQTTNEMHATIRENYHERKLKSFTQPLEFDSKHITNKSKRIKKAKLKNLIGTESFNFKGSNLKVLLGYGNPDRPQLKP